ncbi:MAG TPA: EamA family transporter [Terracidiphilus sp.]|nr:EamA family transporter [Terracidiphilus sp.]
MNPATAPTGGLGLLAAASWGGSDFAGGIGARKGPALLVTLAGQAVSLFVLLALAAALHPAAPGWRAALFAASGGFEGALALALFYRALAMGAMGLTAALTGLITALVPVLFSTLQDGLPPPVCAAGVVSGCAAIWLITHRPLTESRHTPPAALVFAAIAGAGFGTQLVLFRLAERCAAARGLSSPAGLVAIMASARAAGVAALVAVVLAPVAFGAFGAFAAPPAAGSPAVRRKMNPGCGLIAAGAGLLDTAGNLLYLGAAQLGRLDAAAVICSLYPAGTILLAALFLREKPSRRQLAGIGMALAAVALLSR